ncbi:MAG: VWA domain-containing protein [Cyanobacteria bacterium SIG29]|nr:VWA domain-containing protein [Cyanobacteria bacterium SIG29]
MKKLLSILLLLLLITPVFADQNKETLIILDQSASMLDRYNESSKIDYAKRAVKTILTSIPQDERVGLRTVGVHPVVMSQMIFKNPNALCEATALLNRIESNNHQNIISSLTNIMPSGASPLQYTLQLAIRNDFNLSTPKKHIILVTDGYENCDGDPCMYIRREMMRRSDLKIDIVAIGVSNEEKNLLSCLSTATNGKFLDVNTSADIAPISNKLSYNQPNYNSASMNNPNANYNTNSFNNNANTKNYVQYNNPTVQTNTPRQQQRVLYNSYLLEFYE